MRDQFHRKRLNKAPEHLVKADRLPQLPEKPQGRRVSFPEDDPVPTVPFLPTLEDKTDKQKSSAGLFSAETISFLEKRLQALAANQEMLSQKLSRLSLRDVPENSPMLRELRAPKESDLSFNRLKSDSTDSFNPTLLLDRLRNTEERVWELERGVNESSRLVSVGHNDLNRFRKSIEDQVEELRNLVLHEKERHRTLRDEIEILAQKNESTNTGVRDLWQELESKNRYTENRLKNLEKAARDETAIGFVVKAEIKPIADNLNTKLAIFGEEVAGLTVD